MEPTKLSLEFIRTKVRYGGLANYTISTVVYGTHHFYAPDEASPEELRAAFVYHLTQQDCNMHNMPFVIEILNGSIPTVAEELDGVIPTVIEE